MKYLQVIENKLAPLFAKLPSLPASWRSWIATNVWWIVLIIAIINGTVLLVAIPSLIAFANFSEFTQIYAYTAVSKQTLLVSTVISLVFSLVAVILLFAAIKPLQNRQKRGWNLVLIQQLVGVVAAVVSFVVLIRTFPVFSLLWTLIIAAAYVYVLFQIRPEFTSRASSAKATRVVAKVRSKKK